MSIAPYGHCNSGVPPGSSCRPERFPLNCAELSVTPYACIWSTLHPFIESRWGRVSRPDRPTAGSRNLCTSDGLSEGMRGKWRGYGVLHDLTTRNSIVACSFRTESSSRRSVTLSLQADKGDRYKQKHTLYLVAKQLTLELSNASFSDS